MNVYWSTFLDGQSVTDLSFFEPQNLFKQTKSEFSGLKREESFLLCPSFKELTKQTYTLKFPYDYDVTIDRANESVTSDMYDQSFFNEYLHLRSTKDGLISFKLAYIFFSDSDLDMEVTGAHFSENSFTKNVRVVPGKMNISKWVRPVECAFVINKDINNLVTKRGDDYLYLNFCTNEDINLKRFQVTPQIDKIIKGNLATRSYHKRYSPLQFWYDMFEGSRQNKVLLREIEKNLL